jgi:hypothetical protein
VALAPFQLTLCRLIAARRISIGDGDVAVSAALNALIGSSRLSRDVDLFHDTAQAVAVSFDGDRALLATHGYDVRTVRERPTFVEAVVSLGAESVVLQWAADSAFRFFPLVTHPDFGLVLHPFDLATNKVLALVGRLEVRDWVDVVSCDERIQPLGHLAWAACGKDPGFSPASILDHAARSARYTDVELSSLAFDTAPPRAADLSQRWHAMLDEARRVVQALPARHAGKCVLGRDGGLFRGDAASLGVALAAGEIAFHAGTLRGALPQIRGA